jgi:hypothetical protein
MFTPFYPFSNLLKVLTSEIAGGYKGRDERREPEGARSASSARSRPISLEKLSIQDDIVTYTSKDGAVHEFDALEFLAALSCHVPKTYESITKYYGRYSCRRWSERAKLAPLPPEEQESDYQREFRKSSWAACIKRIYEIDPLECPMRKVQMRIIAFIQDKHLIKDIMKAKGIPDFQAPPPIPRFIDAAKAIDELSSYDSFESPPDEF